MQNLFLNTNAKGFSSPLPKNLKQNKMISVGYDVKDHV